MANIINVDTKDKYRVLLTEVLPYELPLWFSNFTLYKRFKSDVDKNAYNNLSGLDYIKDNAIYIPFNYQISRGSSKTPRSISIMHPFAQLHVCKFYHKYDELIEYFCNKSQQSLRYAHRKSTKFYGKTHNGSKLTAGVEGMEEDRIAASSYFKYKKHPFLYSFFESYEYHRLEKKFSNMLQVDISKCFPSIYTHSLSWAVKNKRIAKHEKGNSDSFDGAFDNLMQLTNYRETNGIIIGPEVSRIFSEIILQRIDLNVIEKMDDQKKNIREDYDFRRYVDDYFIFFRDDSVKTLFLRTLEDCLLEYKLHLNESKTTVKQRPFITEISLVKNNLKKLINDIYKERYTEDESKNEIIKTLSRPEKKANSYISSVKIAISNIGVEYTSISNYLFSALHKNITNYIDAINNVNEIQDDHVNWLLVDLDVLFFIYSMDIRIRPTDRLGRLISIVLEETNNLSNDEKELIYKKIFDNVKLCLNIFIRSSDEIFSIETLNLLLILRLMPDDYNLSKDILKSYFYSVRQKSKKDDIYLIWVTFMYYIKGNADYEEIRSELFCMADEYFKTHDDMFSSAAFFMFYFDYLACPYVAKSLRINTIGEILQKAGSQIVNHQRYHSTVLEKDFIANWRDDDYIKNSLKKKQYVFSYG